MVAMLLLVAAGAAILCPRGPLFGRAEAAADAWSPASAISESPTREGSPHLAELDAAARGTGGRMLLTYFQFGGDGVSRIAWRVSADGVNWSGQSLIPGTENGLDPVAAQLPDGEVMVLYAHYQNTPGKTEVDMVRSPDLVNWSAPQTLVTAQGGDDAFVPDITVLKDGRIAVVYSYGAEQLRSDLHLITSDDNGADWSQPQLIYDGPEYDSRARLIQLADGDLLVAFYASPAFPFGSGIPRRGVILVTRSSDGGASWSTPVPVAAEAGRDECWVSLLDLGGGEIWAAFTVDEGDRDTNRPPAIQLVKSLDNGHTWGSPATLDNNGRRLTWPGLARRPDGSVMLVADDDAWYGDNSRDYWSLWQYDTAGQATQPSRWLWSWYDGRNGNDWLLSANLGAEPLYQQTALEGAPVAAAWVGPGQMDIHGFPGIIGGPLSVSSLTGRNMAGSQRILWNRDSFEEIPAVDAAGLASVYYWPWYDQSTPGYSDWILWGPSLEELPGQPAAGMGSRYDWTWYDMKSPGVADWVVVVNPNETQISYEIKIGGVVMPAGPGNPGIIPAHGKATPVFPGVMAGPVEVTSSGGNVMASQRVLWNGHFNEVLGAQR